MPDEPSAPKKHSLAPELLSYGLASIPLLFLVLYVNRYGVDLPWVDQWDFPPLLEKFYQGHVTFHDLWQQHNEHRILFPRIAFLALARLTHWNIRCELAANIIVALAAFLVIARQVHKTAGDVGSRYLLWTIPLISLVAFSLAQYENWLWGWELQLFMNLLAVVAGVVLLTSMPFKWSRLAFSMLLGIVATYSFANGVIYWPLGLLLLMVAGPENRKAKAAALCAWAVCGGLTIWSYLYQYHGNGSLLLVLQKPGTYAEYVLLYLGAPCAEFSRRTVGLSSGALGLVIAVTGSGMLIRRRRVRLHQLLPYIGLASYAIASALLTAVARICLGSVQALATRYIAFSSLLWIADVVFLCLLAEETGQKTWRWFTVSVILFIVLLVGITSARSVQTAIDRHGDLSLVRHELGTLKDEDYPEAETELLGLIYPNPKLAQSRLWILKKHHLSLYRTNSGPTEPL